MSNSSSGSSIRSGTFVVNSQESYNEYISINLRGDLGQIRDLRWRLDQPIPFLPPNLLLLDCKNANIGFEGTLPNLPNSLISLSVSNCGLYFLPALANTSLKFLNCAENQIDHIPNLPKTLKKLECSHNYLTRLELPNGLEFLNCEYNRIEEFEKLPETLQTLICNNNRFETLLPPDTSLPSSMIELDCSNNSLITLPELNNGLITLNCSNNNLTYLPILPNTLGNLICENNRLVDRPNIPPSLESIIWDFNREDSGMADVSNIFEEPEVEVKEEVKEREVKEQESFSFTVNNDETYFSYSLNYQNEKIEELIWKYSKPPRVYPPNLRILEYTSQNIPTHFPEGIEELYIRDNNYSNLPELPISLKTLECSYNDLSVDFSFFSNLSQLNFLDISGNTKITTEGRLPISLSELRCNVCGISELPLPKNLVFLECNENNLKSINIPDHLKEIDCAHNSITTLFSLPDSLEKLLCDSNELKNLPIMPDNLIELDCSNNRITRLPSLPETLKILICGDNLLNSLPELPNHLEVLKCENNSISVFNLPPNLFEEEMEIFPQNLPEGDENVIINHPYRSEEKSSEIIELTSEEMERATLEGSERMRKIHEENRSRIERVISEGSNISLDSKEDPDKFGFNINRCHTDTDSSGENLLESDDIIVFIIPSGNGYTIYCYTPVELFSLWENADYQVYEWILDSNRPNWIGEANNEFPVYKFPATGGFIDREIYNLLKNGRVNTILITSESNIPVGTAFAISRLHGGIEKVYHGAPIHRRDFINSDYQSVNDFYPEDEDIFYYSGDMER